MKSFILISLILLLCAIVYAENTSSEIDECIKKCNNVTSSNKRNLIKREALLDLFDFLQVLFGDLWNIIKSVPEKGLSFLDGLFSNLSKFHRKNLLNINDILKIDTDDDDDDDE